MPKSTFQKPIEIKISTVVAVSAIMYTSDLIALDAAMHEMTGGVSDFFEGDLADRIITGIKEAGYLYVTLDLQGFRSGSMNEVLKK